MSSQLELRLKLQRKLPASCCPSQILGLYHLRTREAPAGRSEHRIHASSGQLSARPSTSTRGSIAQPMAEVRETSTRCILHAVLDTPQSACAPHRPSTARTPSTRRLRSLEWITCPDAAPRVTACARAALRPRSADVYRSLSQDAPVFVYLAQSIFLNSEHVLWSCSTTWFLPSHMPGLALSLRRIGATIQHDTAMYSDL